MQHKNVLGQQLSRDYEVVEKAIAFIEAHHGEQPSLASIASAVDLSEFHFQKIFSRWVGISPKRFLQFLTKEHAKKLLKQSRNLLDVTYDAGLSSPGRLHDLFIHCEAVTPGEYKVMGRGLTIRFGFSHSLFGRCLLGATGRGLCALEFVRDRRDSDMIQGLRDMWPRADLVRDDGLADSLAQKVFSFNRLPESAPLHLFVKGTNFQIKVWEALMAIPFGAAVTYQDIARHIGMPGASRAVGSAVGKNPIPFIIPCHRVIRKMGEFGHYGGGRERKMAMIAWESARRTAHEL